MLCGFVAFATLNVFVWLEIIYLILVPIQLHVMYCIIILMCLAQASQLEASGTDLGKKVTEEWNEVKRVVKDSCKCFNYNCGCCAHLEEREIHLNSTICANISYLVHDYGISLTLTVNDFTLFNETVSARNPPPVCIGVPYIKEFAVLCIRLYDINATTTFLHACVRAEAWMKVVLIAKYEFGCINIGPPGLSTEGKLFEASNAAIVSATGSQNKQVKLQENETSKESNANMAVTVVGITTGLIMVAFIIFGMIALKRKRGNAYSKGLLFESRHNYGSLVSVSRGANSIIC